MPTLAKFSIDLEMATAKFNRQVAQTQKGIGAIAKTAASAAKRIAAIAPVAGAAGIVAITKQAVENQAAVQDMADRLGTSSEALTRLEFAAKQTGVSTEKLNQGLQRQTRRIAEAAKGTGEAKNALKELGLEAGALNQLRPEEQFKVLADAIEGVENPADKVRIAMKLFDSEGVALLQTMRGGSAQLNQFAAEADRLGVTVDSKSAKAAQRAAAAFGKLGGAFTGAANSIGSQFAPEIEAMANFMSQVVPKATEFARAAINLLRKGFVALAIGVQMARLKWNQFVGDTAEAQQLKKSIAILESMNAEVAQTGPKYEVATSAARKYQNALEGVAGAVGTVTGSGDGSSTDALGNELQQVIESLKTQEERLLESYKRRRQIIIENTATESALRKDLMARNTDTILQEIEVQSERLAEAANLLGDPEDRNEGFDKLFGPNSLESLFSDFENIENNFKQLLANMLAKAIATDISNAILGRSSDGGLGDLFGGIFGGFRATGGPVTAGVPYVVGEQGREMFVPSQNGRIVPNNQMGGVSVTLNVHGVKDADSFRRSSRQIESDLARAVARGRGNL